MGPYYFINNMQVTFEANIEVVKCPKDPKEWNQTFQIYPVGLNEALTIHLEMICDCECEKPWNEVKCLQMFNFTSVVNFYMLVRLGLNF